MNFDDLTPAETLGFLLYGLRTDLDDIRRHLRRTGCTLSAEDRKDLQTCADLIDDLLEHSHAQQSVHAL